MTWLARLAALPLLALGCTSSPARLDAGPPPVDATEAKAPACSDDFSKDPKNCGRCGHDCFGGECAQGECQPVKLVTFQTPGDAIALDDTSVYWTSPQAGLFRCPKSGGCPQPQLIAKGAGIAGLAASTTHLYWTEAGSARACAKTACAPQTIGSAPAASAIAIDATDVFIAAQTGVLSCSQPSCGNEGVLAQGLLAIALAPDDKDLIFATADDLLACPKSGCAGAPLTLAKMASPAAALAEKGQVFFATKAGDVFTCAKAACASPTKLAQGQLNPASVATDDANVYWVNAGTAMMSDGAVMSCAKGGCNGAPKPMLISLLGARAVAVDVGSVYVTTQTSVLRIAKP